MSCISSITGDLVACACARHTNNEPRFALMSRTVPCHGLPFASTHIILSPFVKGGQGQGVPSLPLSQRGAGGISFSSSSSPPWAVTDGWSFGGGESVLPLLVGSRQPFLLIADSYWEGDAFIRSRSSMLETATE